MRPSERVPVGLCAAIPATARACGSSAGWTQAARNGGGTNLHERRQEGLQQLGGGGVGF